MEGVVNHHAVKQHLVLDGRSATDVKLSTLVTGEDDARHHLQILGKVGLTAHAGDLGNRLRRDGNHRGLGLGARLNLVSSDGHRLQLLAGLLQVILAVNDLAFRKVESLRNGIVTHARNEQRVVSIGDTIDVEIAIFTGRATKSRTLQVHICEHHRLTCRFLIHKTFDAVVLGLTRQHGKE